MPMVQLVWCTNMFSFLKAKRVEIAKPRWRITVDGFNNYRVENIETHITPPTMAARLYFQQKVFGNLVQAENAIAEFEKNESMNRRRIVKEF